MRKKSDFKPSRWFAWYPVKARRTTHDGILTHQWVLWEMVWRWRERNYWGNTYEDPWVYCTDNPALYYRGRA